GRYAVSAAAIEYVVRTPEGSWRVSGTRVSLDSVVHAYRDGATPEAIAADFPSLSLEQVHGALAFYLRHREEIDRYLTEQHCRCEQMCQSSKAAHAARLEPLRASRGSASDTPK